MLGVHYAPRTIRHIITMAKLPDPTVQDPTVQDPTVQDPKDTKKRLKNLLQSVLAAALGVQSNKNRERDFKEGSAGTFIIAGVLFTVVFVASVLAVVQLVLNG